MEHPPIYVFFMTSCVIKTPMARLSDDCGTKSR